MRAFKGLVSILLSLIIVTGVFTILPSTAFAAEATGPARSPEENLVAAEAAAVVADLDRLYGEAYRRTFLTAGLLRASGRYLRYLFRKLTGR